MGQAKDITLRHKIVADHQQGASYISLSQRYGINYNTVRTICLRHKDLGDMGLIPRYSNCARPVVDGAERVFRLVRLLKHLHPSWGIGYILARLRAAYPQLRLQSERHYQRRLANGAKTLPKPQLPPPAPTACSRLPHDTWQIDAKERIGMADGQERCFLNITDEKTAAVLKAKGFPPGTDLPSVDE
ncbi:MAG: hypothetical protein JNK89_07730 [Saprospiraceae bacterium]|nr:hypothetical protein [Saprospiraceae bacterium]